MDPIKDALADSQGSSGPATQSSDDGKWPAAFRGSILSALISKHLSYIGFADRRAYAVLTINSFLVPISLSGVSRTEFLPGILVAIVTALISIFFAIISLLPKKYVRKGERFDYLMHFSSIQEFEEDEYVAKMGEVLAETQEIGKHVAHDLYRMSTNILGRKFFWLKWSFFTFLAGYSLALGFILFGLLPHMKINF
ncbi:MAG: hypothetical protein KDK37_13580 [Leptospiraceae bacterium]|nr:hypothetical protein [Leptospiraceae bacterium]